MKYMKPSCPEAPGPSQTKYVFGSLSLEPDGTLMRGSVRVHLPPKELAALRLLLENAGQIVSPAQMKAALWAGVHVTADSVPRCLSSLRSRLEPDDCIQTIYKRGYRLTTPVRKVDPTQKLGLPRLAIVPFDCGLSVPPHLGPAIAEETIARLTETPSRGVLVLARDSVFTLASRGMRSQEIGKALKANLVLTGTLYTSTSHFRLRVEMMRVEDETQIWVEDMVVPREQMAELERVLSGRLAIRLNGKFSVSLAAAAAPEQEETAGNQAYDGFLRGRHEWQSLERHRMRDGVEYLLRAAELNPSFLPPRVALVNGCVAQAMYGFVAPIEAAEQIRRVAGPVEDAEEVPPAMLPALGWISFHVDKDLPAAMRMFERSQHLPHDPWTTRMRVMFALSRRQFGTAMNVVDSALRTDPYSAWLYAVQAWVHHLSGDQAQSLAMAEECLSLFPGNEISSLYAAIILAFLGEAKRASAVAHELLRRTPYFDIAVAVHAYTLAREGNRDEARAMLERLEWLSHERFVLRSFTPAVYAALGDLQGALVELRASREARCPWFFQALADPRLKALHGIPEFERMQAELGKMEAQAASGLGERLNGGTIPFSVQ